MIDVEKLKTFWRLTQCHNHPAICGIEGTLEEEMHDHPT